MYGQTNGVQSKVTATHATLTINDEKSALNTVYNRDVVKYGDLKVATVCFRVSPSTTATTGTWATIFDLPTGYEAQNMTEVALIRTDGNSASSIRVSENALQIVFRSIPSSTYIVFGQIVYV